MKIVVNDKGRMFVTMTREEHASVGKPKKMGSRYDRDRHAIQLVAGSGLRVQEAKNAVGHVYWNRNLSIIYAGLTLTAGSRTVKADVVDLGDGIRCLDFALPWGEPPATLISDSVRVATLKSAIDAVNAALAALPDVRLKVEGNHLTAYLVREVQL